ncbi:hypothetical protein P7K49_013333 [Saguinus oedipus]|uniref:C1q domain-containing protein n=1 Tax=Saguinus oedipus TaxID=9490 RepID=A0ABQ9VFL1_SAGOE|nr:hypothetical protein P7K49_013333 [Saguinus oedipus]
MGGVEVRQFCPSFPKREGNEPLRGQEAKAPKPCMLRRGRRCPRPRPSPVCARHSGLDPHGERVKGARCAATAHSVPGAVRQRERAEPRPCTRGPTRPVAASLAPVSTTAREDEDDAVEVVLALLAASQAPGPPRVEAAFHCRLRQDVSVERRALHEIGAYYLPDTEGAFHRGPGLNLTSGQYRAPMTGFYALAATLHPLRRGPLRPRDRLRLLICIQSQCQRNA